MKLKVFAVYDTAVGSYMQPFFMQSKGQAIRSWLDAVNDEKTQFNHHPADFTLFELGEYDEDTGTFTNLEAKLPLGTALDLISKAKNKTPEISTLPYNGSDAVKRAKAAVEKHSERTM